MVIIWRRKGNNILRFLITFNLILRNFYVIAGINSGNIFENFDDSNF